MKRLYLFLFALFVACGGSGGGDDDAAPVYLHGVVENGFYIPVGSFVECRTGDVGSAIVYGTVVDGNGNYEVDVTDTDGPYIVRSRNISTGKWYYGYSADGSGITNINPYTDNAVRLWYMNKIDKGGNPGNVNIDTVFSSGKYTSGAYVALPDENTIDMITSITENISLHRYVVDFRGQFCSDWNDNTGWDKLVDDYGTVYTDWTLQSVSWLCRANDFLTDFNLYYNTATKNIHLDLWTEHGEGGTITADWGDGAFALSLTETKNGLRHYVIDHAYTNHSILVSVRISNYHNVDYRQIGLGSYDK